MADKKLEKKASLDKRNDIINNVWVPNAFKKGTDQGFYDLKSRRMYVLSEKTNLTDIISDTADNSEEMICVSSFLIEDSAFTDSLLKAADRGVRVYLLTAREEELKTDSTEFDDEGKRKEIIEAHKNFLDKIAGRILVRTSPNFHSKFILFDPKSKNACGILSTSNLTKDAMAGRNLELAVELTKEEVGSYFIQFIHGFWNEAKHEKIGSERILKPVPEAAWNIDADKITHPCTCSSVRSLRKEVIRLIGSAKKELIVSAWTFEKGHDSTEAIKEACKRGVRVRIFSRDDAKSTDNIYALLQSGAEVYSFGRRVHAKFIVSDGEALIMTSNFSKLGLDSGFESGILFDTKENEMFSKAAEDLFANHGKQLRKEIRLGDLAETEHLRFDHAKGEHIKFTPEAKQNFDLGEKRIKIDEIDKYDPMGDMLKQIGHRFIKEAEGTITLIAEVPEEKKKEKNKSKKK